MASVLIPELLASLAGRRLPVQGIDLCSGSNAVVAQIFTNVGTPEAAVTAPIGSLCVNLSGGVSTTLYVKTSGTGNTGWTAK